MIERSKNSGIAAVINSRATAVFFGLLLMLVGVCISRAALSVSMIIFLSVALLHKDFFYQLKTFLKTPYLLFFTLLFFIPFASGLWSSDTGKWMDVVRIKLPLLFFPLAFAGNWLLSQKQWLMAAGLFVIIVFAGCLWSLLQYLPNAAAVHADYLKAKTLHTPLENDHVRFSWVVSVAAIVCALLAKLATRTKEKFIAASGFAFFAIYLHVLSARTGLLSLYIFLAFYIVDLVLKNRNKKKAFATLLLLFALPLLAYFLLPTFKARLQYILYDAQGVQQAQYIPGSNDGARVMSLKAGWQVLQQAPLGVGAGDVMHEADKWYAANVPQVLATDTFYPSSEWLMYGAFAGWLGVTLFSVVMLMPFFIKVKRYKIFWIAFNATAAFSFAFDTGLEVQYGVFVYAFTALCWWKAGQYEV